MADGYWPILASANFTRPNDTTAYDVGDLVANDTTAASVTPLAFTVMRSDTLAGSAVVRRAQLHKSGTSIINAQFRLHLYSALPTPSNGDNDAWLSDKAANYLGALDITVDKAFTDGAVGVGLPTVGNEINFKLASGSVIYGLLEALAAYTPDAQEVFTPVLEVY